MSTQKQSGFTLIELLIVVLIIGILAAIAIPVYNGQRVKAKNTVAKSSVRNAYSAASVVKTVTEDRFDQIDSQKIRDEEKTLKFVNTAPELPGANVDPSQISVYFYDEASDEWVLGTSVNPNPDGLNWNPPSGIRNSIALCAASTGNKVYCMTQNSTTNGNFEKVVMGSAERTPSTPNTPAGAEALTQQALTQTTNNW